MKKSFITYILMISLLIACIACEDKTEKVQLPTTTNKTKTILTEITTEPKGAKINWRIFSTTPEIKSTIAFMSLGKTPYKEKRNINIPGLKNDHIKDLFLVLEINKHGYQKITEVIKLQDLLKDAKITKNYKLEKLNIANSNSILKGFQYFLPAKTHSKVAEGDSKSAKTHSEVTEGDSKSAKNYSKSANVYSKPGKDAKMAAVKKSPAKNTSAIGVIDKDPYEPNNSPKKSKSIYVNREYLAKLDSKKDQDYYAIFLGEKPKYKIELDKLPARAKYKVDVFNYPENQKKVYELKTLKDKAVLNFRLKDKNRKTGIYCIRISHLSGPTGSYRLKVSLNR